MNIFDKTLSLLERSLDLRAMRHRVIAANVANEETPGYRTKEYSFLDTLASAARADPPAAPRATHPGHLGQQDHGMPRVTGQIEEMAAPDLPLDGNSVNLEVEMAKLADNAMHYNTASQIMAFRLRQLMSAIKEAK
jgi:flagellar basal-body rod protein FlgB